MATIVKIKKGKRGLTGDTLGQLENFIRKVRKGEIVPFKEKTEHAKLNLKKAGLIK